MASRSRRSSQPVNTLNTICSTATSITTRERTSPTGADVGRVVEHNGGKPKVPIRMLACGKPGCDTALHIAVPANGQLGELAEISERLARAFAWEPAEATLFVVCGHVPTVKPIRVSFHEDMRLRARSRITLVVDPTCTPREVAAQYQRWRKRVFGRIRRLTPQLAALAEFAIEHDDLRWPEQMQSWNASRSSSGLYRRYRDAATFRRDCEQALTRLRDLRLPRSAGKERSARLRRA